MYSLHKITTVADCNVLLTWAEKEKGELLHKHYTVSRLATTFGSTSVEIDSLLQSVIIEININQTAIATMPEGPTKEEYTKKLTRLEYKKFLLEDKKESYGSIALLEKELDLERINKELVEVYAFITTITDHKATLPVV